MCILLAWLKRRVRVPPSAAGLPPRPRERPTSHHTASLRSNIVHFRGVDSSIVLILGGGIPRPIEDFPESLSQAILAGILLVGRLGVTFSKVMLFYSTFLGSPLWAWEFHPLQLSFWSSQALWYPESYFTCFRKAFGKSTSQCYILRAATSAESQEEPARLGVSAREMCTLRPRQNGYLAQRVPSICLASSFRMCLHCEVLKPWASLCLGGNRLGGTPRFPNSPRIWCAEHAWTVLFLNGNIRC